MEYNQLLKDYDNELKELIFESFNHETAYTIGKILTEIAFERGVAITIDISKPNHQLFHFSMEGTSANTDQWIQRKKNVVLQFNTSSIYMALKLERDGTSLSEKYGLNQESFTATGGSVPVRVKGVGMIGAITVAGMSPKEDHELVVETIRMFISRYS